MTIKPKHLSSLMTTDTELSSSLDAKVDKVIGKSLSTEDYTTTEKNKLANINISTVTPPLQNLTDAASTGVSLDYARADHTHAFNNTTVTPGSYGTASSVGSFTVNSKGQITAAVNTAISILSAAVSDFSSSVLAVVLSGLSTATSSAISAADTVLSALGKLQAQITTEVTNRTSADSTLQTNINSEASVRSAEDLTFLKLDGSRSMTGNLDINSNNINNINSQLFNEVTVPSIPTLGAKSFVQSLGGRNMLSVIGKSGLNYILQSHIGRNKTTLWQANGNATTSTIIGNAVSATGTATTRTVATTNLFTWFRRLGYVSAATAGSSAGLRTTVLQYGRGNLIGAGGFHFMCRFGISDAAAVANGRTFIGLTGTTTALANANPSTFLNMICVGSDTGDTNLQIMCNAGSGTATKVDLGNNFPANTRNTDMYEVVLFCPPNGSEVGYQVTNLSSGIIASGSLTSNLPLNTQLMAIQAWRNNGTTALAVGLDLVNIYIETDN